MTKHVGSTEEDVESGAKDTTHIESFNHPSSNDPVVVTTSDAPFRPREKSEGSIGRADGDEMFQHIDDICADLGIEQQPLYSLFQRADQNEDRDASPSRSPSDAGDHLVKPAAMILHEDDLIALGVPRMKARRFIEALAGRMGEQSTISRRISRVLSTGSSNDHSVSPSSRWSPRGFLGFGSPSPKQPNPEAIKLLEMQGAESTVEDTEESEVDAPKNILRQAAEDDEAIQHVGDKNHDHDIDLDDLDGGIEL